MAIYVDESSMRTTIMLWTVDYGLMVEIGNFLLFWPNQHEMDDPLDGLVILFRLTVLVVWFA